MFSKDSFFDFGTWLYSVTGNVDCIGTQEVGMQQSKSSRAQRPMMALLVRVKSATVFGRTVSIFTAQQETVIRMRLLGATWSGSDSWGLWEHKVKGDPG